MAVPATKSIDTFTQVTPAGADSIIINDASDAGNTKSALISDLDTALGLGTLSTQAASSVNISGGSITGVSFASVDINSGSIDGTVIGANSRAAVNGTSLDLTGDATVDGSVTATNFIGDGSALTGIASGTGGVTNTGTTTIGADTDADGAGVVAIQTRLVTRLQIENDGTAAFQGNDVSGVGDLSGASTELTSHFTVRANASPGSPSSGSGIEIYYDGGNDYGRIFSFDRTGAAYEDLRIDGADVLINALSGGGVGIGTTDIETTSANYIPIHLGDVAAIYTNKTNGELHRFMNAYLDSADAYRYRTAAVASHVYQSSGGAVQLNVAPAGALADDPITWETALQVDRHTTAGETRMMIYDVDNGTLERVKVGAPDSAGVGKKVLCIDN